MGARSTEAPKPQAVRRRKVWLLLLDLADSTRVAATLLVALLVYYSTFTSMLRNMVTEGPAISSARMAVEMGAALALGGLVTGFLLLRYWPIALLLGGVAYLTAWTYLADGDPLPMFAYATTVVLFSFLGSRLGVRCQAWLDARGYDWG